MRLKDIQIVFSLQYSESFLTVINYQRIQYHKNAFEVQNDPKEVYRILQSIVAIIVVVVVVIVVVDGLPLLNDSVRRGVVASSARLLRRAVTKPAAAMIGAPVLCGAGVGGTPTHEFLRR